MTTVTIRDEATREVLVRCVWRVALSGMGSRWDETLTAWLEDTEERYWELRADADGMLDAYQVRVREIMSIQSAALGESVKIDDQVAGYIADFRQGMEENSELIFQAPPAKRTAALVRYDASVRLVDELRAEAVA